MQCSTKTCAQQRCFENGNDDFGVEAFWIGDEARVGHFVPLNGPLNGHPPSYILYHGVKKMKSRIIIASMCIHTTYINLNKIITKYTRYDHSFSGFWSRLLQ